MSLTCGTCDEGWICEAHPDRRWPHDDCAGPGIPCDAPTCPYRIDVRPAPSWCARCVASRWRRWNVSPAACCWNVRAAGIAGQHPQQNRFTHRLDNRQRVAPFPHVMALSNQVDVDRHDRRAKPVVARA